MIIKIAITIIMSIIGLGLRFRVVSRRRKLVRLVPDSITRILIASFLEQGYLPVPINLGHRRFFHRARGKPNIYMPAKACSTENQEATKGFEGLRLVYGTK